jgi:hypothetical protein
MMTCLSMADIDIGQEPSIHVVRWSISVPARSKRYRQQQSRHNHDEYDRCDTHHELSHGALHFKRTRSTDKGL